MKSIVTLLFILISATTVVANTNDHSVGVNPNIERYAQIQFSEMGGLLDVNHIDTTQFNEVKTTSETEVARLYKFKNSRIKKALAFKTKRNRAKRA